MRPSSATEFEAKTTRSDGAVTSVFIVDDHVGFRSVASAVVAATPGFVLDGTAATTADALDSLARLRATTDLVLMDVNLADESGIDATRELLAAHPTTKVVFVSALGFDELPPGFKSCGATAYLPKMRLSKVTLAEVWAGAYDWEP